MNYKIKYIVSITALMLLIIIFTNKQSIAQEKNTNLQKLTESSEIILLGEVTNTKSDWNEQRDRIFTKVLIKANEFIKGNSTADDIIITIPGGEVGDVGELYSHMPKFEIMEEVLLFVKRDGQNNYIVNNGIEGKYSINNDENSDIKMNGKVSSVENIKGKIKSMISSN